MARAAVFIGLILLFSSLLRSGSTLKCYACDKCNDPFKKEEASIIDCSTVCLKAKALYSGYDFKKGDVQRDCMAVTIPVGCHDEEQKVTECYCDKDLCNGNDVIRITMTTAIVTFLALLKNIL